MVQSGPPRRCVETGPDLEMQVFWSSCCIPCIAGCANGLSPADRVAHLDANCRKVHVGSVTNCFTLIVPVPKNHVVSPGRAVPAQGHRSIVRGRGIRTDRR